MDHNGRHAALQTSSGDGGGGTGAGAAVAGRGQGRRWQGRGQGDGGSASRRRSTTKLEMRNIKYDVAYDNHMILLCFPLLEWLVLNCVRRCVDNQQERGERPRPTTTVSRPPQAVEPETISTGSGAQAHGSYSY
jgi:hypothetical protein